MSLNVPTFTTTNFSFGPGRLFLGVVGTTPTVDVGAITEDGIKINPENQTKDIFQGNPKQIVYTYNQQQGVVLDCVGIEWNVTNLAYAMGAGNTTSSGATDTYAFGGGAITTRVALHVQHYMAAPADTLDAYIWTAVSNGSPAIDFSHDEHSFPYSWKAQRSTTNWVGDTLAADEELMQIVRTK